MKCELVRMADKVWLHGCFSEESGVQKARGDLLFGIGVEGDELRLGGPNFSGRHPRPPVMGVF